MNSFKTILKYYIMDKHVMFLNPLVYLLFWTYEAQTNSEMLIKLVTKEKIITM